MNTPPPAAEHPNIPMASLLHPSSCPCLCMADPYIGCQLPGRLLPVFVLHPHQPSPAPFVINFCTVYYPPWWSSNQNLWEGPKTSLMKIRAQIAL